MTPPTYGEPSQSEAESTRVPIPTPAAVDLPDWNRSSQERERNDDTEEGEDQLIPIPTTRSLEEDWKLSVQKAFDDPILEPKLHVRSRQPTPSNWLATSAKDNMIALSGF